MRTVLFLLAILTSSAVAGTIEPPPTLRAGHPVRVHLVTGTEVTADYLRIERGRLVVQPRGGAVPDRIPGDRIRDLAVLETRRTGRNPLVVGALTTAVVAGIGLGTAFAADSLDALEFPMAMVALSPVIGVAAGWMTRPRTEEYWAPIEIPEGLVVGVMRSSMGVGLAGRF